MVGRSLQRTVVHWDLVVGFVLGYWTVTGIGVKRETATLEVMISSSTHLTPKRTFHIR